MGVVDRHLHSGRSGGAMAQSADQTTEVVDPALPETGMDLRFLEAMRQAKKDFFDDITEHAVVRDDYFLAELRQEPVYQISEFFYLLTAFGVDSEEKIRRYGQLHNHFMSDLLNDRLKMKRLGLREDRIRKATFNEEGIMKLIVNHAHAPPAFDQSDLARFLVLLMSQETCRTTVVALTKAGFLMRSKSAFKSILVQSNGSLEAIFSRQLRRLRITVVDAASA